MQVPFPRDGRDCYVTVYAKCDMKEYKVILDAGDRGSKLKCE